MDYMLPMVRLVFGPEERARMSHRVFEELLAKLAMAEGAVQLEAAARQVIGRYRPELADCSFLSIELKAHAAWSVHRCFTYEFAIVHPSLPRPEEWDAIEDWSMIPAPKACIRDTNGDGNCGQANCPVCAMARNQRPAAVTGLCSSCGAPRDGVSNPNCRADAAHGMPVPHELGGEGG